MEGYKSLDTWAEVWVVRSNSNSVLFSERTQAHKDYAPNRVVAILAL